MLKEALCESAVEATGDSEIVPPATGSPRRRPLSIGARERDRRTGHTLSDAERLACLPPEARAFEAIPDRELLAQLLALTVPDGQADPMASRLLQHDGSLADAVAACGAWLAPTTGLPDRARLAFRLVWELAARLAREEMVGAPVLASSAALLTYARVRLSRERVDQIRVLYLDRERRLIADELHQSGTLGDVHSYPREILRRALELNALSFVVLRGQPGGRARLLPRDKETARSLEAGAGALGLRIGDYIVIGRDGHLGYRSSIAQRARSGTAGRKRNHPA